MSDARLRELERRARAGDRAARVEWLSARARAGELPADRLRLAAACGDADAVGALGAPVPLLDGRGLDGALIAHGRVAVVRAALGMALAPANLASLARYVARLYRDLLEATLRVVEAPDDAAARDLVARRAAAVTVPLVYGRWERSREGLLALIAARCAAAQDARRALLEGLRAAIDPAPDDLGGAPHFQVDAHWLPYADEDEGAVLESLDRTPAVLADLRAGLGAWALGDPPPVTADGLAARLTRAE